MSKIKRPSLRKYLGEHILIWKEVNSFYSFKKTLHPTKEGDGHPVLILPGFMASDRSTREIRTYVEALGYHPYPWELGRNYGDVNQLSILSEKIKNLHKTHQQKITLIGWSLGGVYARQLAKGNPDLIRQIITLGSPFAGIDAPNNANWVYKLVNFRLKIKPENKKWLVDVPAPAPVPTSAIYSKDDGIVPWQVCMEQTENHIHQNIEIRGTHFGLGYNPAVWEIIKDRLRYDIENWKLYQKG